MKAAIFVLALAAAAASSAMATPILAGLCNTGVDSLCTTVLSSPGMTDPNFITTSFGGTAKTYYNAAWYPGGTQPATQNWISDFANGGNLQTTGLYKYTETLYSNFTGTVLITGNWATDNCGQIEWNTLQVFSPGTTIGGGVTGSTCNSSSTNFTALTAFSISEPVTIGGSYTLDFQVYNSSGDTGLLVTNLACSSPTTGATCASTTPEPSSVLLTLTGFALLGVGIVRRRRAGLRQLRKALARHSLDSRLRASS